MPNPEPIGKDSSITWNIPLQVTVSLGQIGVKIQVLESIVRNAVISLKFYKDRFSLVG
jgi:hypothetical protein